MKRILAIILCTILALSMLTSCGHKDVDTDTLESNRNNITVDDTEKSIYDIINGGEDTNEEVSTDLTSEELIDETDNIDVEEVEVEESANIIPIGLQEIVDTISAETATAKGLCGTNLYWYYKDNVLLIRGTGDMNGYLNGYEVDLPWDDVAFDIHALVIEDGATSIGEFAFYECKNLNSVYLPDSLTQINDGAFFSCVNLEKINIPDSLTYIGEGAFNSCSNIVNLDISDSVIYIGDGAFCNCTSIENINIPNGIESIGEYTFYKCTNIKNIEIPSSIISIGNYAFQGCESLTSVSIPYSVSYIGESAFQYCTGIKEITIPDGITGINKSAFAGCTSLRTVTIPSSINTIAYNAFEDCSIQNVYYKGSESKLGDIVYNINSDIEDHFKDNGLVITDYYSQYPYTVSKLFSGATINYEG